MRFFLFFVMFHTIGIVHSLACGDLCQTKDSSTFIYKTETLQIEQLTEHTFRHISFLQTTDFGNVGCNGMLVIDANEALIFDTPATEEASVELINWVENVLKCKIKGVVATHFHNDCLAGLNEFHSRNIRSYANAKTIKLAKAQNVLPPQYGFKKWFKLNVGTKIVVNEFLGEGHTKDNIVSYFPDEKVLFGGCLIKELGAGKGYLGDANLKAWSKTVVKVKKRFPDAAIIIPGHGTVGGSALLDYTIILFLKK